jgi:hypothetical protein
LIGTVSAAFLEDTTTPPFAAGETANAPHVAGIKPISSVLANTIAAT